MRQRGSLARWRMTALEDTQLEDRPNATRPYRTMLVVICVLALVIRLGWGLSRPATDASLESLPDQAEYLQIARNILDGRGIVLFDRTFGDTLYAFRMPGYPMLIAACGGKIVIVRVIQALLDTSTVLAAFLIGRRLAGSGVGLIGSALVAIHPYLIFFSATLLSETLFTATLVWGMYLLLGSGRPRFVTGALLLVLSIYVRPSAILLPALLAAAAQLVRVIAQSRSPARSFWQLPAGAGVILLTALCLLPWGLRNLQRIGTPVFTTTNGGITLYDGLNPRADGSSNQGFFRNWPELKSMDEVQRSRYLGLMAVQYARENPKRAMQLAGLKIARTWSPMPLSAEYGSNRLYVIAGLGFVAPLFLLAIAGLRSRRINRSAKLYLLLPAIYFTAVHAMTIGSLRYRIPADVPIAVLAAVGVVRLTERRPSIPAATAE
ncbi:MAG: glycosyltransferase family 39 protein [Burkholderiales bacterium]|nr:glycosyltransferase family 39 protein [Phycisphaerae bacterium]